MTSFTLTTDADGVATIAWDLPGRSMNVLTYNGIAELGPLSEGQVLRIPVGDVPDAPCVNGEVAANCWITVTRASGIPWSDEWRVRAPGEGGSYQLLVRANV